MSSQHEIEENYIFEELSKKSMLSANPQMVHKLAQLYGKKMMNNLAKKKSGDPENDMDLMTFFSTLMEMTIKKDDPPEEGDYSGSDCLSEVSNNSYNDRTRYFSVSDHTSIAHLIVAEEMRLKQSMLREKEEFKKQRQAQKDKQKLKRELEETEKLKLKELEIIEKKRQEDERKRAKEEQEAFESRKLLCRKKMETNARKWFYHYSDTSKPRFIDLVRLSEDFDEIPISKLYELEYKWDPLKSNQIDSEDVSECIGSHCFELNRYESYEPKEGRQETPLHASIRGAAKCNDWTIVKFLLDKDINYNIPDEDGMIPLHLSIHMESPEEIMQKMINNSGALIDEKDIKTGSTALHIAVEKGNARCVKMLLNSKARINILDINGNTAESIAQNNFDKKCITGIDKTDWFKLEISSLPAKTGSSPAIMACLSLLKKSRELLEHERIEAMRKKEEVKKEELEKKRLQEIKDEEARKKAAQKVRKNELTFDLTPAFLNSEPKVQTTPSKKKKSKKKGKKKNIEDAVSINSSAVDETVSPPPSVQQSVASTPVLDFERSRSVSSESLVTKTPLKSRVDDVSPPPGFVYTAADLERELLQGFSVPKEIGEVKDELATDNTSTIEDFLSRTAIRKRAEDVVLTEPVSENFARVPPVVKSNLKRKTNLPNGNSINLQTKPKLSGKISDAAPGFEPVNKKTEEEALKPIGSILKSILTESDQDEIIMKSAPTKKAETFSLFNDTKPLFTSTSLWAPSQNSEWYSK
eukprot:NODE_9_length_64580_cov_1.431941.p7 type:complete len:754 gc:universal NODE_9_length_64580_cov_1.431941:58608-60869(+)